MREETEHTGPEYHGCCCNCFSLGKAPDPQLLSLQIVTILSNQLMPKSIKCLLPKDWPLICLKIVNRKKSAIFPEKITWKVTKSIGRQADKGSKFQHLFAFVSKFRTSEDVTQRPLSNQRPLTPSSHTTHHSLPVATSHLHSSSTRSFVTLLTLDVESCLVYFTLQFPNKTPFCTFYKGLFPIPLFPNIPWINSRELAPHFTYFWSMCVYVDI